MGYLRELFAGTAQPVLDLAAAAPGEVVSAGEQLAFAVDAESFPSTVVGISSYGDAGSPAPRIDRARAMQVGAVKRARDLIPGVLGTLPLELFGPDKRRQPWPLFEQPEANIPRSVTMANTFEDVFFEGVAWWRVTQRAWNGWPVSVDRIKVARVTVDDLKRVVYIDGKPVPDADLIRFHSATDGLLIAGSRAIRTALLLDGAAAARADGIPPVEYFTSKLDADPADDDVITEFLNKWQEARRARSTAYIPVALDYNTGGTDPDKLQLAESRQAAVLEIARHAGIDPEDLGVSTTSRTYQNGFERRKALIDFTFSPYTTAVQDTLSMRNVTPRGYVAEFNFDGLTRADPAARWASYEIGLRVGGITPERIAEVERVPVENVRALPPAAAPQEGAQNVG